MDVSVSVRNGTISGTVLSILPTISSQDILKTAVLAVVGASVSFLVTLALKQVFRERKKQ